MKQSLAHVALVVRDYDEAIEYFTERLSFDLIEDLDLGGGKRWVLVAPPGAKECSLLPDVPIPLNMMPAESKRVGVSFSSFIRTTFGATITT